MKKDRVVIRNILIEDFIDMLVGIYESGVDCVNITVEKGKNQDTIYLNECGDGPSVGAHDNENVNKGINNLEELI